MGWNPFSTEISNKMHTNTPQLPPPKTLASLAVLTSSFFAMQNVVQRLVGCVGLYAGRVMPLTTPLGLVATTASICGSNYVAFEFEKFWDKEIDKLPARKIQQSLSTKDIVRRTVLGLSTYTILEGGLFRTTFPSSSIALGAYANTRSMLRSSIVSNSPVASDSQRRRIQQMGKRFGCHQCGNRQLLNNKGFIADHMPPTKRAEELSAVWWRRMMNLKVSQRLWPQCQNCYSVQGAAVRAWKHLPIYHNAVRLHHFAPALAVCLEQNGDFRELCDGLLEPVVAVVERIKKDVKKFAFKNA